MSTSKMIVLRSSDNESFEVEEAVALLSQTVAHLIEDDCADNGVPLANVTSKVLAKVIEYCKKHVTEEDGDESLSEEKKEELKKWDAGFMKMDTSELFELILAANYLNIKDLLDISCQEVADRIKDLQPEDIRTLFNIKNDFSPAEEAKVRQENAWAFDEK